MLEVELIVAGPYNKEKAHPLKFPTRPASVEISSLSRGFDHHLPLICPENRSKIHRSDVLYLRIGNFIDKLTKTAR